MHKAEAVAPLRELICFDTETTGLGNRDEILELAIINGLGEVLFNEYIKPAHHATWPEAEMVHHISPAMVAAGPTMAQLQGRVEDILFAARYFVGYNILYDIRMLKQDGISMAPFHRAGVKVIDVMKNFAPVYGEWNPGKNSYRWQNLQTCCAYYGYDWGRDKAHGALADTKATLYCFKKLNNLP